MNPSAAESLLEKLRASYPDHHRSETLGLLARIHAGAGNTAQGIALLRDCLGRIERDESCSATEVARFSEPPRTTLQELEAR